MRYQSLLSYIHAGATLSDAYFRALVFTGKVVMLTGLILAAAVGTWALCPIKFQADMGILLAFMFLVNMLGAIILLPSLATFLIKSRLAIPAPKAVTSAKAGIS